MTWLYCEREANSETDVQLIIKCKEMAEIIYYISSLGERKDNNRVLFSPNSFFSCIMQLKTVGFGGGGGGTLYNGPCGEAWPERGVFFTLQVYERIGNIFFHSSV